MKIVCLDAATLGSYDLSIFKDFGDFISYDLTKKDERIQRLKEADVVITNKVIIDKEVMDNTPIKLILETATGVNNIDIKYAQQKGIIVKNAANYSTKSVVQHSFALIFSFLNQIPFYDKWSKEGRWCESEIFTDYSRILYNISDKTHGIIGLGTIGKEVAKISTAFGARILYYSSSGQNNNKEYKRVELDELLKSSDIISIHAPLNEKTKNLLTKKELSLMKDGSILINVGRGGIINELDLAQILDEKDIRAGLDVLETEPMLKDHPLLKIKNKERLIITPHLAWASHESIQRLMKIVYNNLKEWIQDGK